MNTIGNMEGNIVVNDEMKRRIKEETENAGMTLKKLANKIPLHEKTLSNLLNGHREMDIGYIYAIAKILNVRPEYLLCLDYIKTENEMLYFAGPENTRKYTVFMDFLGTLGLRARGLPLNLAPDVEVIGEEHYRIDDCPIIFRRIKIRRNGKEETIEPLEYFQLKRNNGSGPEYSEYAATPEQLVTLYHEFKKLSYSLLASLLESGTHEYSSLTDEEYNNILVCEKRATRSKYRDLEKPIRKI